MTSEAVEQRGKPWSVPEWANMPEINHHRLELSEFAVGGALAPTEDSQRELMMKFLYQNRLRSTDYFSYNPPLDVLAVDFKGIQIMDYEVMRDVLAPALRITWNKNYLYFDNLPNEDEGNIQSVITNVLSETRGLRGKGSRISHRVVAIKGSRNEPSRLLGDERVVAVLDPIWQKLHKEGGWVSGLEFSRQVLGLSTSKLLSGMEDRGVIARGGRFSRHPYYRTFVPQK